MSKSDRMLDEKNKTIRWLTIVIGLLIAGLIHAHMMVANMPKEWSFWTPPNIDAGGKSKIGLIPDVEAYNFSFLIFANINTWLNDGDKEYPKKLQQFKYYLSEEYASKLKKEYEQNQGSYRNRLRSVEFVLNDEKGTPKYSVRPIGRNQFEVEAVLRVKDSISGTVIFDEERRYFFIVRNAYVPRRNNPYQMRIVGEYQRYTLEKKRV
mgnify:FL=1